MNNIKRLRKLNDLTQKQLAEKLSRTQPYINQWEREERKPNVEDLIKMSEIFDVSIDEILGTVPLFSNAETYSTDSEQVLRPILGVVKAGYDLYCEENIEGYKPVDKKKAAGAECFWLRVSGNSMNSVGIFDGALVLVKKVPVENRQIGVVRVNGDEATIKQIIFNEDTVVLQPRSTDPTIEPLILKKEDFDNNYAEIIGKVVDVSFDPNDMLK
ncbi:S24 family peptidase [Longibaculum muris]|uniref:S24 family peptidase n=1 Tax=Longibaculum muris TaxID=1796628 RepID=UPI002943F312|nr:S24 family peptidase [Longibaculum muris]